MAKSIKNIALIVTSGTLISKIGGMIRQLVIAGAFGIGPAYDAYNYAYIIPGFFLILLGGINGPFHNAMVTILTQKSRKEAAYLTTAINTNITTFLFLISLAIFILADPIIKIVGPGLNSDIHRIAVMQLQIMAPIAFLSGLIGISFGSLNSRDEFFIPSIAPIFSSISIIIIIGGFWISQGERFESINLVFKGAYLLAIATLIGAIAQWVVQIPSLMKKGIWKMKLVWDWNNPGVREVWKIIVPATLSSGMLQINVFTDLFFASELVGVAAGLSYANFIIQAPLGLISNALLIPLLPIFSKLSGANNHSLLNKRIDQGLMFSLVSMICLGTIFISGRTPIIELIYGRGAFNENAINLVSGLLIAYGVGMPVYLCRDLLVRVFYALGDANTPFKLSVIGIWLNIVIDWIMVGGPTPWGSQIPFNLGGQGLVFGTGLVNLLTCIALLYRLNSRLINLPIKKWFFSFVKLICSGLFSGIIASSICRTFIWPENMISLFMEVLLIIGVNVFSFIISTNLLGVNEVNELNKIFRRKLFFSK